MRLNFVDACSHRVRPSPQRLPRTLKEGADSIWMRRTFSSVPGVQLRMVASGPSGQSRIARGPAFAARPKPGIMVSAVGVPHGAGDGGVVGDENTPHPTSISAESKPKGRDRLTPFLHFSALARSGRS